MRLAVVTSKYPAQTATFFERDMRALLDAGIEIDILAIHPRNDALWKYSSGLTEETRLTRERVHHLSLGESLRRARPVLRTQRRRCLSDGAHAMRSAIRHGPVTAAKTAYVLPKAWAWAAEHVGRYEHILGYWGNYAGTCAYALHRLLDPSLPFSLWLHAGVDLYRTPVFMREKLAHADNVITCCEFNVGFILDRFGRSVPGLARKLHVCHHGLDLAEFPFRPEHRAENRVIAVGRLAAHKGFDYLLQAATIVRARGSDLSIELVGDGEERQALETLATDLGIASHVVFRGWLPFPEARDAMARATVLVHPSDGLGDGLPNVIREAMALGTPVVASSVAGIPDALGDDCGVLVPPRDAMALADGIEAVLASEVRRQEIAHRARRRVEERYDLWRNGARLAALLRDTPRKWETPRDTHIASFRSEERGVAELVEAPNDA